MSNKTDSCVSEDHIGWEWHLEFPYTPGMPPPFPIVPAGKRPKHYAVGIFLLMERFTCSTPESSRNLCVLVCARGSGTMDAGVVGTIRVSREKASAKLVGTSVRSSRTPPLVTVLRVNC
jgi:hypothetical protein